MASQAQTQLRLVISADNSQLISATHTSETALQALQNQAARPISNQFSTLQNQLQNVQVTGNTATQSLFNFNGSINNAATTTAALSRSAMTMTGALSSAANATNNLSIGSRLAASANSALHASTALLSTGITASSFAMSGLITQTRLAINSLGSLQGAFSALAVGAIAHDILQTNREMETLRVSLVSVTGSVEKGNKVFNDMLQLATETPLEIKDVTKAYITLKNFGLEPTQEVMKALTEQTSKLGGSGDTLYGISLALGQAYGKAKLQMQDANQMVERGVPVWRLLSEVTGKTSVELFKMSEAGELGRDVIEKLIQKMGEMAQGSSARAMETLNGKISVLSDSWHKFEDALLQDKSEGFIKKIIGNWSLWLDEFSNSLNDTTGKLAKLEQLNQRIASRKQTIAFFQENPIKAQALGALTGNNLQGEQNRLQEDLKLRQKLLETIVAENRLKKEADDADAARIERDKKDAQASVDRAKLADISDKNRFDALFKAAEEKYKLPQGLLKATASQETGGTFKTDLVSPKGAAGLMQFMPDTAKRFGVSDRLDPLQSIEGAAQYFRVLLDKFSGNLTLAIAAYNAGENRKSLAKGVVPAIPETQDYVKNVLKTVNPTLLPAFESQENQRSAAIKATASINEANVDAELKNKTAATDAIIDNLKALKEQGKIGLNDYFSALTQAQQEIINAQIKANRAKLTEAERDYSAKKDITKPEDLPTLEAGLTVKRTQLNAELNELQTKLNAIVPANIIDLNKELAKTDKITEEVDSIGREGDYKNALGGIDAKDQDAQAQLELGKIDNLQLIDIQRQLEEQRYQLALEYQQKRLALAKDDAKEQAKINQDLIAIQFAHIDTLKSFEAKAAIERKRRLESQFEPLGNAIDGMTQGILEGQQNQEQVIKRSLGNIALSYASSWVKKRALDAAGFAWEKTQAIAHWLWEESGFIRKETRKTLAKLWGEVFQTTTAAAGAKTREGIETAANEKSSIKMAWQAAQGAFSWVMKTVPAPLSWILAPAAGIAAFTGVMMLGSAKQGEKRVQQDGQLYELHKNESVLPADMADGLWKAVDIVNHYVKTPDAPYKQLATPNLNAQLTAAFASGKLAPALAYPQWTAQLSQKIQGTADGLAKDNLIAQQRRNEFTTVKNDSTTNTHSTTQNQSTSTASEVHEHYHFPSATFIAPHEWFNTMVTTQKQHLGATLGQMMRNQYGKKR